MPISKGNVKLRKLSKASQLSRPPLTYFYFPDTQHLTLNYPDFSQVALYSTSCPLSMARLETSFSTSNRLMVGHSWRKAFTQETHELLISSNIATPNVRLKELSEGSGPANCMCYFWLLYLVQVTWETTHPLCTLVSNGQNGQCAVVGRGTF